MFLVIKGKYEKRETEINVNNNKIGILRIGDTYV